MREFSVRVEERNSVFINLREKGEKCSFWPRIQNHYLINNNNKNPTHKHYKREGGFIVFILNTTNWHIIMSVRRKGHEISSITWDSKVDYENIPHLLWKMQCRLGGPQIQQCYIVSLCPTLCSHVCLSCRNPCPLETTHYAFLSGNQMH